MDNKNILLYSDSYKFGHSVQYKKNTTKIYSYLESRGGEFSSTVFFGLQYLLKNYLAGRVVTEERIKEAKDYCNKHLGLGLFNESGWRYILEKYDGCLPVKISSVDEGSVVPNHNVLMTVENTDPNCYWLTNYLETLLVQIWYPCTTSTISREMKKIINAALVKSGDPSLIDFKLHDFGCRGVSSMESAALGGCAHLVNFKGTDTVPALIMAREFYGCDMAGYSIPASEHSTITSWGEAGEVDAFRNMLTQFPTGPVACVSDSWDIYRACRTLWGVKLHDEIMARQGTLVIRPDSGDPCKVVPDILDILGSRFPVITNDKGYKVLDDHVRVIQGDGITRHSLGNILNSVMERGWSADNVAFGSGGGLLQSCNRDTQNFTFKCSSAVINGNKVDVFKRPATASWKNSKKGRLALIKDNEFALGTGSPYLTISENSSLFKDYDNKLNCVFENGKILHETTLDVIRKNAKL